MLVCDKCGAKKSGEEREERDEGDETATVWYAIENVMAGVVVQPYEGETDRQARGHIGGETRYALGMRNMQLCYGCIRSLGKLLKEFLPPSPPDA